MQFSKTYKMNITTIYNNSDSGEHFFDGFYSTDAVKIIMIVFHVIFGPITHAAIAACHGIIWYETKSVDFRHRTLLNQILTNSIFILLAFDAVLSTLRLTILVFGLFCSIHNSIKPCSNTNYLSLLLYHQ